MKVSEMKFEVKEVNQFLINPNALFYGKRMLSPDAEEFIIDEATQNSLSDRIHIRIYLHGDETGRKDEIPTAIHQHFTYRRKKSERKLKKVLQLGWQSLIISIVFFGFLISLTIVILKLFPEGGLSITFREILIILGWVALWRPADLILYEWRPFKREINLFHKLEQSKVEVLRRADLE